MKIFLTFKDKLPKMLLSGFVYKYRCGGWNAIYFGKTKCHFKVRICEYLAFHISLWRLTTKVKIDSKKLRAIQERHLYCNYSPSFEGFSILTRESNHFTLKLMESLLIARDKPALNKADSSLPFELFWYNISGYNMIFYHMMLIYHIVFIQSSYFQFSILCYEF